MSQALEARLPIVVEVRKSTKHEWSAVYEGREPMKAERNFHRYRRHRYGALLWHGARVVAWGGRASRANYP